MYYEPMVDKQKPVHLPALLTFDCVARHLNFGRAATELDVTPTAISKTVKQLESQLGVRLFNRTTRSVALSEPGAQLFRTLGPALEQIRQSVGNVSGAFGRPYGTLRINTSYVAYACLITAALPAFLKRYPEIELEVSLDNTLTDIVAAGFDAGIRLGHALHRDMVAVPLGPLQRRLVFDEMRSVLDAACCGCGLAYVFEQFAAQQISSGALVPVLEKFSPPSEAFHLYYPARTMMPGKLRAFLDFMRELNLA
jgi:DNA-binding transcriptional LysR family regulator